MRFEATFGERAFERHGHGQCVFGGISVFCTARFRITRLRLFAQQPIGFFGLIENSQCCCFRLRTQRTNIKLNFRFQGYCQAVGDFSIKVAPKVGIVEGQLDLFCITHQGLRCLKPTQTYSGPVLLTKFRLHKCTPTSDFSELVPFEAMLELTLRGWSYEVQQPSQNLPVCKHDSRKVWFFDKSPSLPYLRTLLLSPALFDLGLQQLHHLQPVAYYKTILALMKSAPSRLNEVLPNQPLPFYQVLQQRKVAMPKRMKLQEERGKPRDFEFWTLDHLSQS